MDSVDSMCKGSGARGPVFLPRIFTEQITGKVRRGQEWVGFYRKREAFPYHLWIICENQKAGPIFGKQKGFDKDIRETTFPDSS